LIFYLVLHGLPPLLLMLPNNWNSEEGEEEDVEQAM
jgi:hypothetical protein